MQKFEDINALMVYLNRLYHIDKIIISLEKELMKKKEDAQRCTACYQNDGSSNPSKPNRMEEMFMEVCDKNIEIDCKYSERKQIENEIDIAINLCDTGLEQGILRMRYKTYNTVAEIAEEYDCSASTIKRYKDKGLEKLLEKMNQNELE